MLSNLSIFSLWYLLRFHVTHSSSCFFLSFRSQPKYHLHRAASLMSHLKKATPVILSPFRALFPVCDDTLLVFVACLSVPLEDKLHEIYSVPLSSAYLPPHLQHLAQNTHSKISGEQILVSSFLGPIASFPLYDSN